MKTKLLLLTMAIVVFAALGTIPSRLTHQSAQSILSESAEDEGTIAWHIRQAKASGQTRVRIPPLKGIPAAIDGLDQALTQFRVVLAEPIDSHTYVSGKWTLLTWYRFRVREEFSSAAVHPCSDCDSNDAIPSDLLPSSPSEILVPQPGGIVTVDGLTLVQESAVPLDAAIRSGISEGRNEFGQGSEKDLQAQPHKMITGSKLFLLFVSPSQSRTVGKLSLGSRGVFAVNPDGTLETIDGKPNDMSNYLQKAHIASLNQFRTQAERLRRVQ
jgi:hypothetical protein